MEEKEKEYNFNKRMVDMKEEVKYSLKRQTSTDVFLQFIFNCAQN